MRATNPKRIQDESTALDASGQPSTSGLPDTDPPAAQALAQSETVQEKMQSCVIDLNVANQRIRKKISRSAVLLHAQEVLSYSEGMEARMRQCADALKEMQDTLRLGIEHLDRAEAALAQSQSELAQVQADEQRFRQRALHDQRTGLPNRELFNDRLAHALSQARRHGWDLAVLFLDIDRFKSINDKHGHAAGDTVLGEIAKRLTATARSEDTACRNGGDEFLFLLMNPQGQKNISRIANALQESLGQPIDIGGLSVSTRASIGIAVYPGNGTTGERLIDNADAAMYRAKKGGRGHLFF